MECIIFRRTLGAAAVRSGKGKPNNSELHRTYDNLTVAYSTEVRQVELLQRNEILFMKRSILDLTC